MTVSVRLSVCHQYNARGEWRRKPCGLRKWSLLTMIRRHATIYSTAVSGISLPLPSRAISAIRFSCRCCG